MRTRYVWRNGAFVDPSSNESMQIPDRVEVCMPLINSDITEYVSPVTGKLISSRSTRRYDLESNGCIEADPPKKHRGYRNPKFAKKHGLKLAEDATG